MLNRPIYPFDSYVNLKDMSYNYKTKDGVVFPWTEFKHTIRYLTIEKIQEIGFSCMKEFNDKVVPIVPEGLVEMLKYLKVFKDEKTIHKLKPAIYTYWC